MLSPGIVWMLAPGSLGWDIGAASGVLFNVVVSLRETDPLAEREVYFVLMVGPSSPARKTEPAMQIKSSAWASLRACCQASRDDSHNTATLRCATGNIIASCSGVAPRWLVWNVVK